MPQLATHQIRVAAVAHMIADAFDEPLRIPNIVSACLLHDMGNILKFDLARFPEFVEPEGRAHWEAVKASFTERYGPDEHIATLRIAGEIGVSNLTFELIGAIGFTRALENRASENFEKKICCYADMRVAPHGIVSLADRLAEGKLRYAHKYPTEEDAQSFELTAATLREMEKQIFSRTAIDPKDITDASAEKYFSALKTFSVI